MFEESCSSTLTKASTFRNSLVSNCSSVRRYGYVESSASGMKSTCKKSTPWINSEYGTFFLFITIEKFQRGYCKKQKLAD